MKYLIIALLSAMAYGQQTIQGPITITYAPGTSPTGMIEFNPATTQWPCITGVAETDKTYVLCGKPGIGMMVDLGDGNHFQPLKGKDGQSIVGPKGDKGDQGLKGDKGDTVVGPAWSPAGKTFTISCTGLAAAKGGTGVPKFNVQLPVLTGCTIQ